MTPLPFLLPYCYPEGRKKGDFSWSASLSDAPAAAFLKSPCGVPGTSFPGHSHQLGGPSFFLVPPVKALTLLPLGQATEMILSADAFHPSRSGAEEGGVCRAPFPPLQGSKPKTPNTAESFADRAGPSHLGPSYRWLPILRFGRDLWNESRGKMESHFSMHHLCIRNFHNVTRGYKQEVRHAETF
jgi:hypothetical protein